MLFFFLWKLDEIYYNSLFCCAFLVHFWFSTPSRMPHTFGWVVSLLDLIWFESPQIHDFNTNIVIQPQSSLHFLVNWGKCCGTASMCTLQSLWEENQAQSQPKLIILFIKNYCALFLFVLHYASHVLPFMHTLEINIPHIRSWKRHHLRASYIEQL